MKSEKQLLDEFMIANYMSWCRNNEKAREKIRNSFSFQLYKGQQAIFDLKRAIRECFTFKKKHRGGGK